MHFLQGNAGGKEITLSAKEYAMLEYFMYNQGRVLSREMIEDHVWNFDYRRGHECSGCLYQLSSKKKLMMDMTKADSYSPWKRIYNERGNLRYGEILNPSENNNLVYCSIGGNSTICISDDFVVSRQILIKTIQDSLVETVENNVDEIEYFSGMDEIRTDADIDYLIDYRKGYLEIDDDFLSKVNEVYTGLYDEKSRLIYGENPIAAKVADLEFVDSEIQKVMKDGTGYYILTGNSQQKDLTDYGFVEWYQRNRESVRALGLCGLHWFFCRFWS